MVRALVGASGRTRIYIKILWDFNVQIDREIQTRRPDILVKNRKDNECFIIDIAVLADAKESLTKSKKEFQDVRTEVARLWNTKSCVVPFMVTSLGMAPESLAKYLKKIG